MKQIKKAIALMCAASMVVPTGVWVNAEETEEPVTITWYRRCSTVNDDEKMVEDAINAYIEPLIGVRVNVLNSAESTEISLALAAGDDIDLWWDANWNCLEGMVVNGSAYNLADVIDDYPLLKDSIPEQVWDSCREYGGLYYVPVYKESGTGYGLAVPTAMVEKYGWDLSSIEEIADLEPMLADMYADGVEYAYVVSGTAPACWMLDDFVRIATTSGGNDYATIRRDDPSQVINYIETEEYKEYCELMHSWFEKGYINEVEASESVDTAKMIELASTGNLGFVFWSSTPDGKANATSRYGVDMEVIDMTGNYISVGSAAGSVYCVNAKTEKIDAVMKFLGLLSTDETLANLALYGIEGEHYNMIDGKVEMIPDSGYSYGSAWCVCNVNAPSLKVGEADDKKEQYEAFNNSLVTCVSSGFKLDKTNVEAELTALDGAFAEYRSLLEKGVYDPEEYLPKLQEALRKGGVEKCIAEVQTQWDAFQAQ